MGRGGGGGGSRGSSGGGSRGSSGRISSSSSRGSRSSSSSRSYSSSRSSYSGSRSYHSYGWGPRRTTVNVYRSPVNLAAWIITFVVVFVVLTTIGIILSDSNGGSGGITRSTVQREALPKSAVNETGYLTDELGWINSRTKLESGMKDFYKRTGVQPYLYITDRVDGSSVATAENMEAYALKLYDELFTDEAHVLVLFHEAVSSDYSTWCIAGTQAKTVLDNEGRDILLDYIDHYYYSDLEDDEMFSTAFKKAGERLMTVTKSPVPGIVLACIVVIGMLIAFSWWKMKQARDAEKAAETERILNAPLSGLGTDPAMKDLEDKYT